MGLTEREEYIVRETVYRKRQRRDLREKGSSLRAELPRRSLAAYAVQPNCVCFPQVIIKEHSLVDVAPILGVNHVKSTCYVMNACDCT